MIYTDGAHLIADSLDELSAYAIKINLNWDWLHFSGKNIHPHFDICGKVRARIMDDASVKIVSKKEIIRLCKLNFRAPETDTEKFEWEQHHGKKLSEVPTPTEDDFARMFKNIKSRTGL